VPYDAWKRDGYVTATPGNTVDYEFIRKTINDLSKKYSMVGIAYDNWNASSTAQQLESDGRKMVEFGQGFADMNEPTKELERLVIDGNIRHGGNPVLRWMASNVTVRHDAAENIRPDKMKSTDRIDGIVSLIMAIGLEMVHSRLHSRYETEDLVVI
jgi:phage terminase large subunit-like protein